jgi:radical SAM superfamily enzyme YgiQ (UPF0313 family)
MNNVYLFQPNYQSGIAPYISQWLPYSVASIWAYVEQYSEIRDNFEVKECIFRRYDIDETVERLDNPKFCLFGNYIWNENYNLLTAEAIKKQYPDCVIVFGGPQVDDNAADFLQRNPFVDTVVINEGEHSLYKVLSDYLNDSNCKPIYDKLKRVELDAMPSPYVDSSIMDKIIKDNPDTQWATTLETNRGCPFACSFCDWGSLTQSKIKKFNLEKVFAEIDWIVNNKVEYLYIADANFGVFYERDKEIVKYLCKKKLETGYPHNLNMTWYKNSTKKTIELVMMLHEVGLNRGMTLSVQSMTDKVLESIERKNMEISKLGEMYKICNDNNVKFYTEFILGLPEETKQSWRESLCQAVQLGCHNSIEIFPLEVLRNSELYKQTSQHNMEIFRFQTVEPRQLTSIPENHNFVIGTKYMNKQELVDSWLWGWLLINFHTYGWTQVLSKVAYKYANIKTIEFYENFFDNCVMQSDFFKELYENQKRELEKFFWESGTEDTGVFQNDDIVVFKYQMEWHKNREQVQQEIQTWAREYLFDKLPEDLLEDAITYTNMYTVAFDERQDETIEFNFNLPEYCATSADLVADKNTYRLYNTMDWTDYEDFSAKIYFKHRYGFSRREHARIENG